MNNYLRPDMGKSKLSAADMNPKTIVSVGSIALDWLELPDGTKGETLGGSLTYFTRSAGILAPVNIVGVVGTDFPKEGMNLFREYAASLEDLQIEEGKSFRWGGRYHDDWENRTTLYTELGVFETFSPKLSNSNKQSPLLYLGNIHPALQLDVLSQMASDDTVIVCDTMNLWINTTRGDLDKVLGRIDILLLNENEAELLTGIEQVPEAAQAIRTMGPKKIVVKQGGSGSTLISSDRDFHVDVYPIDKLMDPTGAGDSFAGGLMAALANGHSLEEGLIWATASASFCVEGFGLEGLSRMTPETFRERVEVVR